MRGTNTVSNVNANQSRVVRCYNCRGEGNIAKQCTAKKRVKDAKWFKEKILLAQAQETGVILHKDQQDFLAYRLEDMDGYCDDKATACVIYMESLSPAGSINGDTGGPSYASELLSEVPHYDTYHKDTIINDGVQDMEYNDHVVFNDNSCDELMNKNAMILSVIEQMKGQVEQCNTVNLEAKSVNESLSVSLNDTKRRSLQRGQLKIESEPINAYFKNNKAVHRDYLKVFKEHVETLQELLEEARALKPLDEHIGNASKFAERIQELLVYVSASCPFTKSRNEKWAPAMSHKRNNKPYVDTLGFSKTSVPNTQQYVAKQSV
ncbi:retrovirus-related pol polyprotein from transposon TNT 1-94 [Tanacetum coccineum]